MAVAEIPKIPQKFGAKGVLCLMILSESIDLFNS